jgi:outer membrane protein assembly factor BamD
MRLLNLSQGASPEHNRPRGAVRLVALAMLGLSLAGCAGLFDKKDDEDIVINDEPAEKIYNEGLTLMNKEDYEAAAKRFEDVDRQQPYSDWARKALLMLAYVNYTRGEYTECISAAKRYIALHPGSPDAAYAQFLMASSMYDQIPDISRDQQGTQAAILALQDVVRKYPTSEYAVSAKKKVTVAQDQIAGKEMMIGRYYLEQRNYTGAINRFKVVVTQYQTTRHVEEALYRLTEAYMALGIVPEAQTSAAVLGYNFPDSPWYKDAYKLVQSRGVDPKMNDASWIAKAFKKMGLSAG